VSWWVTSIGTGVHLVFACRASTVISLWSILGSRTNSLQISPPQGGVEFKRAGAFPARRGRLGAVHGGSRATRIAGITSSLNERLSGRLLQVRLGTFGSEVGGLAGFRESSMSILVIILKESSLRNLPRHDFSAAKARVGSPSGRGGWFW
jgi:hypothetical protein